MKRIWYFVIVGAVIIIATGLFFVLGSKDQGNAQVSTWQPIAITEDNLPQYLSQYSAIKKLPEEGLIALVIGEKSYTLRRGSVTEGMPEGADLTISLPASYFDIMGQKGWCAALGIAQQNGELLITFEKSAASLGWKYKSLLEYKSCLE